MKENFIVGPDEKGMTLLAFLRKKVTTKISVKGIKRAIDGKKCRINGHLENYSTHPLKLRDRVEIDLSVSEKRAPLTILYEDDDYIICDKPVGLICERESVNWSFPKYGDHLELVHRLDKETSGIVILAKSLEAKEAMIPVFKEKKVKKLYLALVDKEISQEKGEIRSFLVEKRKIQGQTIWGSAPKGSTRGLEAITLWKAIKVWNGISLLEVETLTGRTHQIRVHLSEMGHPILGDVQYGKEFDFRGEVFRNMLHAYRLEFEHPRLKKTITVQSPIPEDFKKIIDEKVSHH